MPMPILENIVLAYMTYAALVIIHYYAVLHFHQPILIEQWIAEVLYTLSFGIIKND